MEVLKRRKWNNDVDDYLRGRTMKQCTRTFLWNEKTKFIIVKRPRFGKLDNANDGL